jgi:xylan 1,4-beta-xylosidase
LIERTDVQNGPSGILDHGGSDVPAVSTHEFADTGVRQDVDYHYRIGAVAGAEYPTWAWSEPVSARTLAGPAGPLEVRVDASMVSGRLSRVSHMVG